jgi:hypothetical protein
MSSMKAVMKGVKASMKAGAAKRSAAMKSAKMKAGKGDSGKKDDEEFEEVEDREEEEDMVASDDESDMKGVESEMKGDSDEGAGEGESVTSLNSEKTSKKKKNSAVDISPELPLLVKFMSQTKEKLAGNKTLLTDIVAALSVQSATLRRIETLAKESLALGRPVVDSKPVEEVVVDADFEVWMKEQESKCHIAKLRSTVENKIEDKEKTEDGDQTGNRSWDSKVNFVCN